MAETVAPGRVEAVDIGFRGGDFKDFFGQVHVGAYIHGQFRIAKGIEIAIQAGRLQERRPVGEDVVMRRHDDQCFRFLADNQSGRCLDSPYRRCYLLQLIAADFRQHNRRMGK